MPSDVHRRSAGQVPLVTISGALISYIHTAFGFLAFFGALFVALSLHYHKVVKNGVAGWPQEYWPSVSATIGDWYPERNLFQIAIALMSGPRFALVFLSSMLVSLAKPNSFHARILLVVGVARTLACGGWVYVTSSDDHDVHDVMMGAYLVLTPPWMFITSGSLAAQPNKDDAAFHATSERGNLSDKARKMRRLAAFSFFAMIPFMVYFFYRHKMLEIPGAYTHYAFFEWGLIIFDLLFDCASMYDLSRIEIQIVEAATPALSSSTSQTSHDAIFGGSWLCGGTEEAVNSGAWSTPPISIAKQASKRRKSNEKSASSMAHREGSWIGEGASILAESFLAYLFWTSLTGLHPEIFFFSVYNMGVGGHEALLVIQVIALSVAMLPPVQNLMLANPGHSATQKSVRRKSSSSSENGSGHVGRLSMLVLLPIYALCLVGFSVWMIEDALIRLIATALSCVGFTFLTCLEWGRAWEAGQVESKASIWIVGILLSSLAKYANHSNNPAWAFLHSKNGGQNAIFLLLGVLAITQRLWHLHFQSKDRLPPFKPRKYASHLHATISAVSLGSLIFALHILLSDSGTLIAWTWTGHPATGPNAVQHGSWLLTVSAVSTLASLYVPNMAITPLFWAFGAISVYMVYAFQDWTGFVGALGTCAFLPPLAAPLLKSAMSNHPVKTMWLAWLTADLLAFLQVLTAAYAFIPGGKVMRERTGTVLLITICLLIAGLSHVRTKPSQKVAKEPHASNLPRRLTTLLLICITLVTHVVPVVRHVDALSIQPHYPTDRVFTAGIWTIHFSLDQSMWDSSRRIASLIDDMKLDVVGLLETDLHRTVFGNRDLTQYLAHTLGMYVDIGPGPDKHTWGAALLSKFPIIKSTHHLLPSPNGELAPAIHAVLDVFGVATHVVVSHNGQEEDPLDRELQTTKLAQILSDAYPHPAVFLGYVVTKPHAKRPNPYEILFTDGRIFDVDPTDEDRWCEYIGFRALERVGYVRVSRYTVTDTELQTAKFRIPAVNAPPIDPDKDVLPYRTMQHPGSDLAWTYPLHFIDPPALVYARHKYSPWYYPLYFNDVEKPLL